MAIDTSIFDGETAVNLADKMMRGIAPGKATGDAAFRISLQRNIPTIRIRLRGKHGIWALTHKRFHVVVAGEHKNHVRVTPDKNGRFTGTNARGTCIIRIPHIEGWPMPVKSNAAIEISAEAEMQNGHLYLSVPPDFSNILPVAEEPKATEQEPSIDMSELVDARLAEVAAETGVSVERISGKLEEPEELTVLKTVIAPDQPLVKDGTGCVKVEATVTFPNTPPVPTFNAALPSAPTLQKPPKKRIPINTSPLPNVLPPVATHKLIPGERKPTPMTEVEIADRQAHKEREARLGKTPVAAPDSSSRLYVEDTTGQGRKANAARFAAFRRNVNSEK